MANLSASENSPDLHYGDVPDDLMRRIKAEAIADLFEQLAADGFVLRRLP
jgi:hypothetical protein